MFKYTVTEENFSEMSIYLMKQKSYKTSSVIKLFLFTVVQMAVIGWLITRDNDVSVTIRVLMAVFSVLWAGRTIFRFGCFKLRAKLLLNKQRREDPNGDFWQEHRLSLRGNKVLIRYGAQSAELDCRQITGTQETDNLILLMSENRIFEIVPRSVTERSDWDAFLDGVFGTAQKELKQAQDKQRASALSAARFQEYIQIEEEELVRQLVRMKRHSLRYFSGWSPIAICILLIPLILLSYFLTTADRTGIILSLVFFFLMNAGQLMILTPLYKRVVRQRIKPAGEQGYLLIVTDKNIVLYTKEYQFRFAIDELRQVLPLSDVSYYYFAHQEMVFVPAEHRDAFQYAVTHRHTLSELTKIPGSGE